MRSSAGATPFLAALVIGVLAGVQALVIAPPAHAGHGLDGMPDEAVDGLDTAAAPAGFDIGDDGLHINVRYHTLENGLRVVLSEDHTVPTATVGVYYGIGYRREPRGRTGFAHLFEHLFFAGSENLPVDSYHEFVSARGGMTNASTRLDFTNYFTVVPSNALDTVLWAEADRMASPTLSSRVFRRERDVVRNEIFVNVENQPYGGASWIDLPMIAFDNWHNAHNFYGDLSDLDAATITEARDFFERYYTPTNAVLVVAGAFDSEHVLPLIERYFGTIPAGEELEPVDVSETRQTGERRAQQYDRLAQQPYLVLGYRMPERGTPEYYAMALIDQLMLAGNGGRLQRRLVDERGYTSGVTGGINLLGNVHNYDGPMLWTVSMVHSEDFGTDPILADFDAEIARLQDAPLSEAELQRARTLLMTEFYGRLDYSTRLGIIDLFDDDPHRINRIEDGFDRVTPDLIQATAREYLRPENRTILEVIPGTGPGTEAEPATREPKP